MPDQIEWEVAFLKAPGFEWGEFKHQNNIEKHGISFETAIQVLVRGVVQHIDRRRSYGEDRTVAIGESEGREIVVVYTRRGENLRIISARRAKRHERRTYREIFLGRAAETQK